MSQVTEAIEPWVYDPDSRYIELDGCPIFRLFGADDFPCIEDGDRFEAERDYLAHAGTVVLLLNAIARGNFGTTGEAVKAYVEEQAARRSSASPPVEQSEGAWEDRCRDCDDTGITIQTERRCACQPPLTPPPVTVSVEAERLQRIIRQNTEWDAYAHELTSGELLAIIAALKEGHSLSTPPQPNGDKDNLVDLGVEAFIAEADSIALELDPDWTRAEVDEVQRGHIRRIVAAILALTPKGLSTGREKWGGCGCCSTFTCKDTGGSEA